MALQFGNRVRVAITSTGTGTLSLGSAVTGMTDFSGLTSGSTVYYVIEDATGAWEVGQGTYTSGAPSTLSRDTVEASSSGTSLISLTAGAQVYIAPSAAWLAGRADQAGLRNALINGNMDWWQRGTSFTATGYNADRWTYNANGSGAVFTISKQAATEALVLNAGPTNWWNIAITTAPTGQTFHQLIQKIENVRTFAGRTVTLSFYAKATTALTLSIILAQNFGTGGSPSSTVNTSAAGQAITTTAQRFSVTVNLPTISGLTRGSNGDDSLQVVFGLPLNAANNVSITGVQLEPSNVATTFERRPEQVELELCQRYYQTGSGTNSFYTPSSGNTAWTPVSFGQMRAAPTLTVTPSGGSGYSAVTGINAAANSFVLQSVSSVAGLSGYNFNFTAVSEL